MGKFGENARSLNANVPAEVSSDEDGDGCPKPMLDSGHWGIDPPRTSTLMDKKKRFADGFGLCSPGGAAPVGGKHASTGPNGSTWRRTGKASS